MNAFTQKFITSLWEGDPQISTVERRLKKECEQLSAIEAGVIGRDLILRKQALYTKIFNLAAFLATEGGLGSDGFMDFADCTAILPEERYSSLLANPDLLIDDSISSNFSEIYAVREICNVFDRGLFDGADGEHFLDYLVLGDDDGYDWDEIQSWTAEDARTHLPRLYKKSGHLFAPCSTDTVTERHPDAVGLNDLIPGLGDS